MNSQVDDHMLLVSHYYPEADEILGAQFVQEQVVGENVKPRRRRRKNKGGEGGGEALMRKRKLSEEQVNMLEKCFGSEHKLESERKDKLAAELGLDPRQVAVWFQNRRARWKSKKLEEEYNKLRSQHESTVVEKCRLESQVIKMKEQLDEAEKEIQRLSLERYDGFTSNSPSSSLSMEESPLFADQFGIQRFGDVFNYIPEANYVQGMEWDNNLYYIG